ncbi:hypothetical protein Thimo_1707 [Thioflavicoccus mobilis 8321]|uniref:Uncharacterized protein n=1 Tax=Thioflavicoccus mobilis 8321 TaxID=765912 RepID=L0GYW3_9GAMM|nr:hypothetical protein [Thioflavicoccus mobilis]AGA90484.1 hypothetical protein Thimo_1707 [Thioflavicoccus mobilis 8321]
MASISNDHDLRDALNELPEIEQRILGARFAEGVAQWCREERVDRAIKTALRADASPTELEDAYRAAKSYATKTYTDCGKDTDWLSQADHFVAAAAAAALTPEALLGGRQNRAWKAAVQARMAVNCAMMEDADEDFPNEAERQYLLVNEHLSAD